MGPKAPGMDDGSETDACDVRGASADVSFGETSTAVTVTTNGCPATLIENAVGQNPNTATVQASMTFRFPKTPVFRSEPNTNWATALGAVGWARANVYVFGPATGPDGGDAGAAPPTGEIDTFDYSGQHAAPSGEAHYHVNPPLLADAVAGEEADGHSGLLAVLVDGFPVYGLYGAGGVRPTDLDECGGHSSDLDGSYHYHVTGVEGPFPTTVNNDGYSVFASCLRGCVLDSMATSAAQDESYADCVASSSPAPGNTYVGDLDLSVPTFDYTNYVYSDGSRPEINADGTLVDDGSGSGSGASGSGSGSNAGSGSGSDAAGSNAGSGSEDDVCAESLECIEDAGLEDDWVDQDCDTLEAAVACLSLSCYDTMATAVDAACKSKECDCQLVDSAASLLPSVLAAAGAVAALLM